MIFGFVSKKKLADNLAKLYMKREADSRTGTKEERLRAWDGQSAINYIFSKHFTEKQRKEALNKYEKYIKKDGKGRCYFDEGEK